MHLNLAKIKKLGFKLPKKSIDKYDQKQLKKGMKVEFEHTKDKDIALAISCNHLDENPRYYLELAKMEAKFESLTPVMIATMITEDIQINNGCLMEGICGLNLGFKREFQIREVINKIVNKLSQDIPDDAQPRCRKTTNERGEIIPGILEVLYEAFGKIKIKNYVKMLDAEWPIGESSVYDVAYDVVVDKFGTKHADGAMKEWMSNIAMYIENNWELIKDLKDMSESRPSESQPSESQPSESQPSESLPKDQSSH